MRETDLTQELVAALRRGLAGSVVFKHTDMATAGIPDISATWLGSTTWIEGKRETIRGSHLQSLTMRNLRLAGYAIHVVWLEDYVFVVDPLLIKEWWKDQAESLAKGRDVSVVVEYLRAEHAARRRKS